MAWLSLSPVFSMSIHSGTIMNLFNHPISDKRFQHAVSIVLLHEGGLSNDKEDRGGDTNFGISLRYLRDIKIDVDGDGDIDGQDIRKLTRQEAIFIYKKYWWDKYKYNDISNLDIATKIFDLSVNMGGIEIHKIVQRALNVIGSPVTIDGILGNKTFYAINNSNSTKLLIAIRGQSKIFYINLIKTHPKYNGFKEGWLRRVND